MREQRFREMETLESLDALVPAPGQLSDGSARGSVRCLSGGSAGSQVRVK